MGKELLTDITFCQMCDLVLEIWDGTDRLPFPIRSAIMTAFFERRDIVESLDRLYWSEEKKSEPQHA